MSWITWEMLHETARSGEINRIAAEQSGLLRGDGILRPLPVLGGSATFSASGYLSELVNMDEEILYTVRKFSRTGGHKPRKRPYLKRNASVEGGTRPGRRTT